MELSVIGNEVERVIVTEAEIAAKVKELAGQIEEDYRDRPRRQRAAPLRAGR